MKCILVTGGYPYGSGETFLDNEIPFLADAFEQVAIYVSITSQEMLSTMQKVPDNVLVFPSNSHLYEQKRLHALFNPLLYQECFKLKGSKSLLRKCSAAASFLNTVSSSTHEISHFLDELGLSKEDNVVVYSYWLSRIGMTALNIRNALEERHIHSKLVSRCHGFDLYQERETLNYLPFQKYMLSQFERIYPCSKNGTEYLKIKIPEYSDKIETAYLGIPDRFQGKWPTREPFNIVSCSGVNEVKRVIKIAEALREIKGISVHWTHFGDGPLFGQLKEYVRTELPENITVDLPGRVDNSEVYRYYQEHSVSLFINASSSEGLPVSIMEACSFGIPVVATDVGGTSEIVEDGIEGILLKHNFSDSDLANAIREFWEMKASAFETFCRSSRYKYVKKYKADINFPSFIEGLHILQNENWNSMK